MDKIGVQLNRLVRPREFSNLLLILIGGFPIYKSGVTSTLIILFSVSSIYNSWTIKGDKASSFFRLRLKYFLITVGFYIALIFSLTYTSDVTAGISQVVRSLPILILPLILFFFTDHISTLLLDRILHGFLIGCLIYLFYLHYEFYKAGLYSNFKPAQFYDLPFRDVILNLSYAAAHPTYASIWFLFGALYLAWKILRSPKFNIVIAVYLVLVFILIGSSVLLSSKIAILGFFVSLIVLLFYHLRSLLAKLLGLTTIVTIFFLAVFNISFLKSRFVDEYNATELKPPIGLATNSLNIRVGIFQCTSEIFDNNWLFGVGLGDVQSELNKCYQQFDTDVYKTDTYNTHNEYLNITLACGVFGLILFLSMLVFHLADSHRTGNVLFIVFLVFMIVCMMPENLLARHHGIIFYSLFSSLLIKQNLQKAELT